MSKFPDRESEIRILANAMYQGFYRHRAVFPDPPVYYRRLLNLLLLFDGRSRQAVQAQAWAQSTALAEDQASAAQAVAEAAMTAKINALDELIEAMKKNLQYAEHVTNYEEEKLQLIGWSTRRR